MQSLAGRTALQSAWAWLLNALNAADLGLHAAYAGALALAAWRLARPASAAVALLAGAHAYTADHGQRPQD